MSDLARRLQSPSRAMSLQELMAAWLTARITVRVTGCAVLAQDLVLMRRIRGALGQVLLEAASPQAVAGQPCPWQPPCALDVLFREQGRIGDLGIPKPYVLATDAHGADLLVTLRLFGLAADWAAAAAQALVVSLRHRINWRDQRPGIFIPRAEIADVTVREEEGVSLMTARSDAELVLLTPMNAEGDGPKDKPHTIFARLERRIKGLARWHDAALDEDWRRLATAWEAVGYDITDLRRHGTDRRSGRTQHDFQVPTVHGSVLMTDMAPDLWPLLALGQITYVGKGASEGFGRYRLS